MIDKKKVEGLISSPSTNLNNMSNKDKSIIDRILTVIGADSDLEKLFADEIFEYNDMSEDEFSEWLSRVKI